MIIVLLCQAGSLLFDLLWLEVVLTLQRALAQKLVCERLETTEFVGVLLGNWAEYTWDFEVDPSIHRNREEAKDKKCGKCEVVVVIYWEQALNPASRHANNPIWHFYRHCDLGRRWHVILLLNLPLIGPPVEQMVVRDNIRVIHYLNVT